MASVHLQGPKRGAGAFVRDCCGERFSPSEFWRPEQKQALGERENYPAPRCVFNTVSAQSCPIRPRQNAQGKGRADGSKKEPDKRRASQVVPARVTSPRSAGRFKGFRALERGRMRGSHLNLGAHLWGLILFKCPLLAALSGGHRGDTAHRPPQKMRR